MKYEKVMISSTFGDLLQSAILEKYKNAVVYSKTFPMITYWWFRDKSMFYVFKRPNSISSPKVLVLEVSIKFPTSKIANQFCRDITDSILKKIFNKRTNSILL